MNLKTHVESLLFITNKPLTIKKLAELTERNKPEIETVVQSLIADYNSIKDSGIKIMQHNDRIQMATASESSEVVENFLKQELTGEMTRPQLETLTIIAYRGPITKMEMEQIRGVNCSLILRNLMMRGLVEAHLDKKISTTVYNVTEDFVRYLGITSITELPDYKRLSSHEVIQSILERDMGEKKNMDSVSSALS